MKTDETNPQDWFLLAAERMSAADVLYAQSGSTYTGIEILHEAVERYLKGFLIGRGWGLRKVHDLTFLIDQAKGLDTGFAAFDELCESLTEQFWAQHYPGGDLSTVGSDYESLRQQAGELIALIRASIPPSSGDPE
jgi:HEPN domain-containing protein